jgi:hypothetical protein
VSERLNLSASTRKKIERTLDKLIGLLDALDPDPDLEPSLGYNPYGSMDQESDDADNEPSLGATHALNQEQAWRSPLVIGTDLEFDGEGVPDADKEPDVDLEPDNDDEPSLGSRDRDVDQLAWSAGGSSYCDAAVDLEHDNADREPSLGSRNALDQMNWSRGSRDDREDEHNGREPDEDFERDPAENGVGDEDGAMEQWGVRGGPGERIE